MPGLGVAIALASMPSMGAAQTNWRRLAFVGVASPNDSWGVGIEVPVAGRVAATGRLASGVNAWRKAQGAGITITLYDDRFTRLSLAGLIGRIRCHSPDPEVPGECRRGQEWRTGTAGLLGAEFLVARGVLSVGAEAGGWRGLGDERAEALSYLKFGLVLRVYPWGRARR